MIHSLESSATVVLLISCLTLLFGCVWNSIMENLFLQSFGSLVPLCCGFQERQNQSCSDILILHRWPVFPHPEAYRILSLSSIVYSFPGMCSDMCLLPSSRAVNIQCPSMWKLTSWDLTLNISNDFPASFFLCSFQNPYYLDIEILRLAFKFLSFSPSPISHPLSFTFCVIPSAFSPNLLLCF